MHALLPSERPDNGNFVQLVLRHSCVQPWVTALHVPRHTDERGLSDAEELSFGELGGLIARARAALRARGLQVQDRVVVLYRPSAWLYATVLALLAEGLVPVFMDTGMKPKSMLQALADAKPRLVVTAPELVRLHWLIPGGRRCPWLAMEQLWTSFQSCYEPTHAIAPEMHGLISYTSGTTGRPKGADRTHDSLIEQHRAIRQEWPDGVADIDMTSLPVVVLHNLCCGMPSVLPVLKFSAPGQANADWVLRQIEQHQVTRLSGAPAFMERLARGCLQRGQAPASLREISLGGAAVSRKLGRLLRQAFPQTRIQVVYGSTEAEPIASCDIDRVIDSPGQGFLVGPAAEQAEIRLCRIPKDVAPRHDADLIPHVVSLGEIGELLVSGPHVLKGYVDNPEATRQIKVPRANGSVWHRTGDLARFDEQGNLWLLGRTSDQVYLRGALHPVFELEAEVLDLPEVRQAALVQVRQDEPPTLFYALEPEIIHADIGAPVAVESKLFRLLAQAGFSGAQVHSLPSLPVDRRHNSKIDRNKLRRRL